MSRHMRFHATARTVFCQALAMAAFIAFVVFMERQAPAASGHQRAMAPLASAAVFVAAAQEKPDPPEQKKASAADPMPAPAPVPRRPEQFRPSQQASKDAAREEPPPAARPKSADLPQVAVPPRDLPLSYLMKFRSIQDFHSFLDKLPPETAADGPDMALIRIEGLPAGADELKRLFESYDMKPFLFNPDKFNYIITDDLALLRDKKAIGDYIASVGRYLQEDGQNAAYRAVRSDLVARARADAAIAAAITDPQEFSRMKLGLASVSLNRFFHRLEQDTAQQLTDLSGKPVAVRDIARIDCRFRDVNGAVVLVPCRACLGSGGPSDGIAIWQES